MPTEFVVVVPQGVGPGDEIEVNTECGHSAFVRIPRHSSSGDLITVEIEAAQQQHYQRHPQQHPTSPGKQQQHMSSSEVEVVVPEGIRPGEAFTVETHDGLCFDVVCPDNCFPGDAIVVALPSIEETPSFEQTMEEAPEAPPQEEQMWWHTYRPGTRVKCLRSDGCSYSDATVVLSYEGVFGTLYQVRLDSGQEKMAVPEEELFDAQDADDPNFGVHFAAALAAAMEAEMLDSACGGCDFYD